MQNRRCVCGKIITSNFDLCEKCMLEYGKNREEWPDWLVFMVADMKRERRQDFAYQRNEITFSDLGLDVTDGPEISAH